MKTHIRGDPPIKKLYTFFDPLNLLIVFMNVFAFIVMETLFFYFVASKNIDNIIIDKSNFMYDFFSSSADGKDSLRRYLQDSSNEETIPAKALIQRKERFDENIKLVLTSLLPVLAVIILINVIVFFMMVSRGEVPSRIDLFLLFTIFGAFSTELVFYLTVISKIEIIGDIELLSILLPKDLTQFIS